jgi:hypothetical protein
VLSHLFAEVAASGVDYKVLISLIVNIKLYKMISAAQSAYAALKPVSFLEMFEAMQVPDFRKLNHPRPMYISAAWDAFMDDFIEPL